MLVNDNETSGDKTVNIKGNIEVKDVAFSYYKDSKNVLNGLSSNGASRCFFI